MPRLQRRDEETLNLAKFRLDVESWWSVKFQSKLLTQQLNAGRDRLKAVVQRFGVTDPSNGSMFLDLEESVGNRKIAKLKAQRSVSTGLNSEEAERILKEKGLWDEMVEWVPVLDEGRIHAAYYDRKITDDELSKMFPQSISFSLILLDDDEKPVN
jgi:hypothetical protein